MKGGFRRDLDLDGKGGSSDTDDAFWRKETYGIEGAKKWRVKGRVSGGG